MVFRLKKAIVLIVATIISCGLNPCLGANPEWAQVKIAVGCIRELGKYSAEMSTQAIMGTPVRLLEKNDNDWWKVETPDGYTGWIYSGSLAYKTPEQLQAWRNGPRLVVTDPYQIHVYTSPTADKPRDVVTDLVTSAIVEGSLANPVMGRIEVTLPDGRKGWADASKFDTIEQWAAQDFDPETILDEAYSLMGSSYLWGGMSPKAMDCSGLVRVCYMKNGYILMRDASQQARTGTRLSPEDWSIYQPGDLLFFGNKNTGKVTHVAIYDGDGWIVHCASRVRRNHLDKTHPEYVDREVMFGTRIHGNEGAPGITQARNHPWYFDVTK